MSDCRRSNKFKALIKTDSSCDSFLCINASLSLKSGRRVALSRKEVSQKKKVVMTFREKKIKKNPTVVVCVLGIKLRLFA